MAFEPSTLQEAILHFARPENCHQYVVSRRWPNGVTCPICGGRELTYLSNAARWQCKGKHEKKQFSLKTGTIFEDSPLSLSKWLPAMWLLANCKNGISSYEIHRDVKVTQKTAWFMMHRIRLAMQAGSLEKKMCGTIEADETFIGGKAINMHLDKRTRLKMEGNLSSGSKGKAIVLGLLDRETRQARIKVMPSTRMYHLRGEISRNVEKGSQVYTDALHSYRGLPVDGFTHDFVDHAVEYVKDAVVHTNGLENFWSLFKRTLKGTYVSVEPFHLQGYADEQAFRYNNRKTVDGDRFHMAVKGVTGRRITYKELTGKDTKKA